MSDDASVTTPGTHIHTFRSQHVDQEYRISVALPYSYASQPEQSYPTIYLLDANLYFGMVTESTRIMERGEELPAAIVVGISYPIPEDMEEGFKEVMRLRARDLTPVANAGTEQRHQEWLQRTVKTGGAEQFLAFIEHELIPLIEAEYRAAPDRRVLTGHSLGGLFTLYTLFHRPKLFAGYVAASPALYYGEGVSFTYEERFAQQRTGLPVRLYLGVGECEEDPRWGMVSQMYRMAALLDSRKYEGLHLTRHIALDWDHCGAVAPTLQAGIRAVLA